MRLKSSIAIALMGALVLAPAASSHDLLLEINPAAGAVLTDGSFQAKLSFNNPLLVVAGESNAQLDTKPVGSTDWTEHEVSVSDRVLTARVVLGEPGEYDLRWKVVSSDGHPISGTSTFILDIESSVEPSPSVISPGSPEVPEESERSMVGFYIGLAMVVLGVIFAPIGLVIRRRAMRS
jgi:methionine-rich copper-binding protein CopC